MNADVLNQSSNQVALVLEAVRNEALSFADRLHTIQGGVRLQGFDPHWTGQGSVDTQLPLCA